jgi:plasmid stabilization system protein ParE
VTPRHVFVGRRAQREADEAARWYESESKGLGSAFVEVLERVLAQVEENPRQFPAVHRNIRRALLKRFPYGVFFRVLRTEIKVIAIIHLARHPWRWQSRS